MTARVRAALLALIAGAAVVVPPTATAAAGSTICVALVVDFSAFGAGTQSSCVTVPTGSSGSDVLAHAHRVTFDPRYGDGFVCAIDGHPAGGCHATDGTHYWVYYHRPPGSQRWQVSEEGAGSYQPRNGATEGWVYDDGSSTDPAPPAVAYTDICRPASASPAATRSPPQRRSPAATRRAAATAAPRTPGTPDTAGGSTRRRPRPSAPVGSTSARPSPVPPTPVTSPVPAGALGNDVASPSRPAARRVADTPRSGAGPQPPYGLVAGLALLAALGAGALWRRRRRTEG